MSVKDLGNALPEVLKVGTPAESEDLLRMAKAFFEASPYATLGIDEDRVRELVAAFTKREPDKLCVCLMDGSKAVGVLAAVATQNIFNNRLSCVELMWWIDPEYRGLANARKMVRLYEYWAKTKVNAQCIQLITLEPTYGNFYQRMGFVKKEEAYVKEL